MIELKRYQSNNKTEWDNFLEKSRIDTFLFKRDFMDYHADRFQDCSFLIYRKNKLEALLPGNFAGSTWYSHQGLTYGGLVSAEKLATLEVLEAFEHLNIYLKSIGIQEVIYKPTPHIYHVYPSHEDIYALFKMGAEKIACNISSTISLVNKFPFAELRKRGIKKALKENVLISESMDYVCYWDLLVENLQRTHGKSPVHTIKEIEYLKSKFPNNIRLFCSYINDVLIGGVLLFIMKKVVHVQYISANDYGKNKGALDLLFHELINNYFADYSIFDFGQSTEESGNYLNEGLIFQKEGFGGRGIVYETYKYEL